MDQHSNKQDKLKVECNLYKDNCKKSMEILASDPKTIFLGQTAEFSGSAIFGSLTDVKKDKKLEMPIAEDMQMGISIGLALEGFIPISIYPRIDFLICAVNQLCNHLDKIEEMSHGEFKVGIIIRTQIGNTVPLYPGIQHCCDYTEGLKKMVKNIKVIKLEKADEIVKQYKLALASAKKGISTLLVEIATGV